MKTAFLGALLLLASPTMPVAAADATQKPPFNPTHEIFETLRDMQLDMAKTSLNVLELQHDRDDLREQVRRLQDQLNQMRAEFEAYHHALCIDRGIC